MVDATSHGAYYHSDSPELEKLGRMPCPFEGTPNHKAFVTRTENRAEIPAGRHTHMQGATVGPALNIETVYPRSKQCPALVCQLARNEEILRGKYAREPRYEDPWCRWVDRAIDFQGTILYNDSETYNLQTVFPYRWRDVRPHTQLNHPVPFFPRLRNTIEQFLQTVDPHDPKNIIETPDPMGIGDAYDPVRPFATASRPDPDNQERREKLVPVTVIMPIPKALFEEWQAPTQYDLLKEILPEIEEHAIVYVRAWQLAWRLR